MSFTTKTTAAALAPLWPSHNADEKSSKEKFSSAAASTATASAAPSAQMYHASAAPFADKKSSTEKEEYSKDYLSRHAYRTELCGKLLNILNEHGGWNDQISQSLRAWSVEVISFVNEILDDATYLTKMATKVKALGKILNNFINPGCSVQVPYIDCHELLWEKADLIAYLERKRLPPIDSQTRFAEHHKFAQAISEWVKVLPDAQSESSAKETGFGSAGVLACATSSSTVVLAHARAETLISNELIFERAKSAILKRQEAIAIREFKQLSLQRQHKLREQYADVLHVVEESLEKGKESLATTTKQHEASKAMVNQRLGEMGHVHRATVSTLHHRIDRLNTNLTNSTSQLNGTLSTVQQQKSQIAQLAATNQALADKAADLQKYMRQHHCLPKLF